MTDERTSPPRRPPSSPPIPLTRTDRTERSDTTETIGLAGLAERGTERLTVRPRSGLNKVDPTLTMAQRSRYHIGERLGSGGIAEVHTARDVSLRREVAIKTLRSSATDQAAFVEEAQIAAQLEHPNIVPIHEIGVDRDNRAYIAMKRVRGQTLRKIISDAHTRMRRNPDAAGREWRRLLEAFLKVCDAIGFAHSRSVIHRDIKPDNVMVGEFGEVVVMDWGLARPIDAPPPVPGSRVPTPLVATPSAPMPPPPGRRQITSDRRQRGEYLTTDGFVVGTLPYMSPEQARGVANTLDTRTDIYSLGATLYTLLTDSTPFTGNDPDRMHDQVLAGILTPPSKRFARVPRELEAVVLRAMAHKPAHRYADVSELRADVERYLDGRTVAAVNYSSLQLLGKWIRRNRILAGGMAMTGLVGIIGLVAVLVVVQDNRVAQARVEERAAAERDLADSQAQYRELLLAGRVDALRERLGLEQQARRDQLADEFERRYRDLRTLGLLPGAAFGAAGAEDIDRYIAAFEHNITVLGDSDELRARDEYYLGLLRMWGPRRDREAAGLHLNASINTHPTADAYSTRGWSRLEAGNSAGAIEDYTHALELDPENAELLVGRSHAHPTYPARLEDLNHALQIDPTYAPAYVHRSIAHYALGNGTAGMADLQMALRYDPADVEACFQMARRTNSGRDIDNAVLAIGKNLRYSPNDPGMHIGLSMLYLMRSVLTAPPDRRDLELARQHAHHAIAQPGYQPDWNAWRTLAVVEKGNGNIEAARTAFERAIRVAPANQQPGLRRERDALGSSH